MAPSACRLSVLIWSLALLVSLLVPIASSTTVTKTHITTTQITVNDGHHGIHAVASTPKVPNSISGETNSESSLGDELLPDLELNRRTAQNAASTSTNPSMLWTIGTHPVYLTAGEVTRIDGTMFSLDTGSGSVYFLNTKASTPRTSETSVGAGGSEGSSASSTTTSSRSSKSPAPPGGSSSSGSSTTSTTRPRSSSRVRPRRPSSSASGSSRASTASARPTSR